MIGSTANIVALGMLERKSHIHVSFFQWLKVGFISALLAAAIAWAGIMLCSPLMPDRYVALPEDSFDAGKGLNFDEKMVIINARLGENGLMTESENQEYNITPQLPEGADPGTGLRSYYGVISGSPENGYTLKVDQIAEKGARAH